MKTLDEVITALNMCQRCACEKCPYYDPNVDICDDVAQADALHYLKEFQGLSKMWNDKLDKEQENPPLDWETLKQMEGKPVWVEEYDAIDSTRGWRCCRWMLVEFVNDFYMDARNSDGEQYNFDKGEETWQAYRKERS